MKYKRIIFISLLLSLISLMCLNAISQELPFLMDLAQLKLEVTNTEVVDQISSSYGLDTTTLSANEGYQLVVVTLKGIVPHPRRIIIKNSEFSVIYEKETSLHIEVSCRRPSQITIVGQCLQRALVSHQIYSLRNLVLSFLRWQ
jgi:hypothetical protein